MTTLADTTPERIAALRRFNRFYTRRIGVLDEGLLHSPYTLAESRLLWELAHRSQTTAAELAQDLNLDPGYLSRLLGSLKQRGLVQATRSPDDGRQQHLALSDAGRSAFAPLDERSRDEVAALLTGLADDQQQQLLNALATVERLLDPQPRRPATVVLRPHRAGDLGWVVSRHGALYTQEHGWNAQFEALVARIAADFLERFDPAREACWIAERDGAPLGSVMLVQARDGSTQAVRPGVAQLRLLLVEPGARGLGIGARLVAECERQARQAGYQRIVLWTNEVLRAARGLYRQAGYRLVTSELHHNFGHAMVGETWELELR